jgi:NAD(P)-dependent dehydrogenase (short-subunit alcohol dehydrogenase family)
MSTLIGRSGLVTGASRGIGKAIAMDLGRAGATVAIGYSQHAKAAEDVVSEVQWAGGEAFSVHIQVEDRADVRTAIASVADKLGHFDFLVNNAGINRDRTLAKMTPEQWDEVIGVDLTGVFNVTHEVVPYMIKANHGRIVNVASVTGLFGTFGQANYVSAKAGIIGFTKTVARELARNNITVNCIAPGYTETEMVDGMPDEAKQRILQMIPLGRFAHPDEIGQWVTCMITHGDYLTGEVINVSGGFYM